MSLPLAPYTLPRELRSLVRCRAEGKEGKSAPGTHLNESKRAPETTITIGHSQLAV